MDKIDKANFDVVMEVIELGRKNNLSPSTHCEVLVAALGMMIAHTYDFEKIQQADDFGLDQFFDKVIDAVRSVSEQTYATLNPNQEK